MLTLCHFTRAIIRTAMDIWLDWIGQKAQTCWRPPSWSTSNISSSDRSSVCSTSSCSSKSKTPAIFHIEKPLMNHKILEIRLARDGGEIVRGRRADFPHAIWGNPCDVKSRASGNFVNQSNSCIYWERKCAALKRGEDIPSLSCQFSEKNRDLLGRPTPGI